MKRIIATSLALLLILAACASPPQPPEDQTTAPETTLYEPEPPPAPELELSPSVQAALEDFLGEMLPIFTRSTLAMDGRTFNIPGWELFVRHRHQYPDDFDTEVAWGYPYAFKFHDPVADQRVHIEEVPYLRMSGDSAAIAWRYWLQDLDDNGIPVIVVEWAVNAFFAGTNNFWLATFYHYTNGRYEPAGELTGPFALYRDQHERIVRRTWVHQMGFTGADFVMFHDGDIELEPIIMNSGINVEDFYYYNHLTGERITEWEAFIGYGEMGQFTHLPGFPDEPLTPIPHLPGLQHALTETITARLLAEGRIH